MTRVVVLGVVLIIGAELLALITRNRALVPVVSGAALALVLLNVRRALGKGTASPDELESDDESLRRWLSSAESTIRWAESTRSDWDRHLRPMLARRYEILTGHKQSKDSAAYHAGGQMLFGADLWEWVNPNNIVPTGDRSPGPGRAALGEILERLEMA
jgi:hypothetical protein